MVLKKIKKKYSEDLGMNECVFCKIIAGEIPAQKVYEDTHTVAFLDIHPSTRGHTLLVSKKHYALLPEVPEKELIACMKALQKLSKGLLQYGSGLNILQNNGKDAGQLVPHVHFHLIPRRPGDGVLLGEWRTVKVPDMDRVQKEIQSLLK